MDSAKSNIPKGPTFEGRVPGGGFAHLSSKPPPGSPLVGGEKVTCEKVTGACDSGTQTVVNFGRCTTFSPKLCSELLPTLSSEQIQYEIDYINTSIGQKFDFKLRNPSVSDQSRALSMAFSEGIASELVDNKLKCKNYSSVIFDLSCTVDKAQRYIEELTTPPSRLDTETAFQGPVLEFPEPEVPSEKPVCFIDVVNFSNINMADICQTVNLQRIGNRQVAYFGPVDYRYNKVVHKAAEYPATVVFDNIREETAKVVDDFSFEEYSCLLNYYENSSSNLNYHCDDEDSILPDSTIYCISLGGSRNIRFRNTVGPVKVEEYPLPHGCVYSMTRSSQDQYEHCIPESSTTCGPRLSLTFRRHTSTPVVRPAPPPIHKPSGNRPQFVRECLNPSPPQTYRVLNLGDSILGGFPMESPVEGIEIIKKRCMHIGELDQYESEFAYTDVVVLSFGINDITRYETAGHDFADLLSAKLRMYSAKYPNVDFVYNSIVYTRFGYFDKDIDCVNYRMFELSLSEKNVWFFDSHYIVANGPSPLAPGSNGAHITYAARARITSVLGVCIARFVRGPDFEPAVAWPLDHRMRRVALQCRARYSSTVY